MKIVIPILISIAQVIGYAFLVIAGYYLILGKGFNGEYSMGFGIGLVYGSTILLISSLVALVFKKYYSQDSIKYFKKVLFGTAGVFLVLLIIVLFNMAISYKG